MKIDKEEATELVNKVYTPDILRDSLVKAAIKLIHLNFNSLSTS